MPWEASSHVNVGIIVVLPFSKKLLEYKQRTPILGTSSYLPYLLLKIYCTLTRVCLCECMQHVWVSLGTLDGAGCSGVRITGNGEQSDVGAGNQAWVPYKSRECL